MTKNYVLHVLRLLDMDEMIKLSKVVKVSKASFKKAAGQELFSWDDDEPAPTKIESIIPKHTDNVLEFRRPEVEKKETNPDGTQESSSTNIVPSELVLWQREISREHSAPEKQDALKGYRKFSHVYIVKEKNQDGTSKTRVASTGGVLVNKKQE